MIMMAIMNLLLSTLLLLFTTPTTVHSKSYIRQTQQVKPRSNDDPNKLNFNFSLQSTTRPTKIRRVANSLETFGTTLFEGSVEYGDRFMWFTVEPLMDGITVAESRGGWRGLQLEDEEEGGHTSSYEATLMLFKSREVYSSGTEEEDAKRFFLNALNANSGMSLDSLLGEWTAVEYVAPVENSHTTGEEVVLPPNNNEEGSTPTTTEAIATPKPAVTISDNTDGAIITDSENTTDESGGRINNNVIGIAAAVLGVCLVAFLIVAFAHRSRQKNTPTDDPDHIGDLHLDNNENDKSASKWAGRLLLPARIKSNKNTTTNTLPTTNTAPVEVNEIDKVLADLHDSDDSSFISAASSADDDTSSGYSGLTGISDLNYPPKHSVDGRASKALGRVEEMKPSISFLDQSKGSLIRGTSMVTRRSMKKESSFESDPSSSKGSSMGTAQSVRKEESFESDYRDKSAMATLNLRKDMLNTGLGEDDKARTISAQDNTEMLQQQRQVDKVRAASFKAKRRMRSGMGPVQKSGDKSLNSANRVVSSGPDESRNQLLSSQLQKSDDLHINEIV